MKVVVRPTRCSARTPRRGVHVIRRVAVFAGTGKTGQAVIAALRKRNVDAVSIGRREWNELGAALRGCGATYLIAPNMHPDEPAYVATALAAMRDAGVTRVVYHSVASPYAPSMPHHVGKAVAEDLIRRSGLEWTILQPGAYLQNLDLTGVVRVPYDVNAVFGFADIHDLAAAAVLLEDGHVGATYEIASRVASVADVAAESGVSAVRVDDWTGDGLDERERTWLRAMFDYYDQYGLRVGTLPLKALLSPPGSYPARSSKPRW
jgi:NAD(P)H dehydrogenase (quinone)